MSRTLVLGHERPIRPLLTADRRVGVQPEDQEVALLTRELQQVGVAVVQDVEAAVGEDDLAAGLLDLAGLLTGQTARPRPSTLQPTDSLPSASASR